MIHFAMLATAWAWTGLAYTSFLLQFMLVDLVKISVRRDVIYNANFHSNLPLTLYFEKAPRCNFSLTEFSRM